MSNVMTAIIGRTTRPPIPAVAVHCTALHCRQHVFLSSPEHCSLLYSVLLLSYYLKNADYKCNGSRNFCDRKIR